ALPPLESSGYNSWALHFQSGHLTLPTDKGSRDFSPAPYNPSRTYPGSVHVQGTSGLIFSQAFSSSSLSCSSLFLTNEYKYSPGSLLCGIIITHETNKTTDNSEERVDKSKM